MIWGSMPHNNTWDPLGYEGPTAQSCCLNMDGLGYLKSCYLGTCTRRGFEVLYSLGPERWHVVIYMA